MQGKNIGIAIFIILVIAGGVLLANARRGSQSSTGGQYCGSDGKLITTKPVQSHRSYCIKSMSDKTFGVNIPSAYTFSIIDDQGNALKEYETVHEKDMHVIVTRKDLAEFQHVHPNYNAATGEFTLADLTFPTDGPYRIFADFTPKDSQMDPNGDKLPVTISEDVTVGDLAKYQAKALGAAETSKTIEGYQVSLKTDSASIVSAAETKLSFVIIKDGQPVTNLDKYLGALGHSVILKENTLDFLHTHALSESTENQTGTVDFMATFPTPGKYKAFGQFQQNDKVFTADFIIDAAQGSDEAVSPEMEGIEDMPGMAH